MDTGDLGLVDDKPEVVAALRGVVGLRARDGAGLLLALDELREERLRAMELDQSGREAMTRLTQCEAALRGVATGDVIRACDWQRQASRRLQAVRPCVQQIPRVLRRFLVSELPGHCLIDCDLVGAHGQIAAILAEAPHEGWVYTPPGRREGAAVLGWTNPSEPQLKAVKVSLLALQMGAGAKRILKDHLAPTDSSLTAARTDALEAWWRGRTPNIQRVMQVVRDKYEEWAASGRPAPGVWLRRRGGDLYFTPSRSSGWRGALAVLLQSYEANIMDRTLLDLKTVPDARLVTPMYDGLLVSAPAERAEQVAEEVRMLLESAARHRINATTRIGETWPA
jgi:hypothetical protein